jgi:TPR repeat protein
MSGSNSDKEGTSTARGAWVDEVWWGSEPDLERLRSVPTLFDVDPVAARTELEHLAALGSVKSMTVLGTIYRRGQGTRVDLFKAESWYLRAAELGYVPANYCLGLIYLRRGYHRKAVDQFRIAADRSYMPGIHMLGNMYCNGRGIDKDLREARRLWEWGNSLGFIHAKTALAKLLMTGKFGLLQWLRGVWLEHQAPIFQFIIERKNPADPRLN